MKPHTEKFLQKRKFIMVLPALVVPFLTVIFWALGGGKGVPAHVKAFDFAGLNLTLPTAHFEEEIWDKLSLYERAARDSAKYEEARESDPYFDLIAFKSQQELQPPDTTKKDSRLIDSFKKKDRLASDPNEERVNKKLQQLYSEINKASVPSTSSGFINTQPESSQRAGQRLTNNEGDSQFTTDVDRLEQMMEMMHDGGTPDPEMQQIESVLEKILDIQHPERVKEKLKSLDTKNKSTSLPVEVTRQDENISLLNTNTNTIQHMGLLDSISSDNPPVFVSSQNGFFGLDEEVPKQQARNAIEAIIHDTQELVAGSTVKLRLLDHIEIKGIRVPKDQFVYGVCAINGERLTIGISSIRINNSLLPVSLDVYDLDGLPGIYIPGAITRDAAKQASDNALQNIQLMSLDPSIGAQAAAAGVEAAKGLFSKKAKLIKVTVKAGYQVYLKDSKPTSDF